MAFDIELLYDSIYRYCFFKLRNAHTAEDITQEAFLRYWEHYHPMPSKTAVKYLYTIARRLCIDEYRKGTPLPLDEGLPAPPQEDRLLTQVAVRKALSALTVEEQELILLRHVDGLPIGTIGSILGISRFSVYRRLKAADKSFHAALNKEGLYDTMEA